MAHTNDKLCWCAGVYIVHKNKVLLRLHEKYNIWIHVGGHIELDEDPVTAAKRECKEEVGLDVRILGEDTCIVSTDEENRDLVRPAHMNIHRVTEIHEHIDLIYYGTSDSTEVVPESPNDKWEWLSRDEIEQHQNIRSKIRRYALEALDAFNS